MRTTVWPLLLVLTPTLCAQTEPPPRPLVPMVAVDPSRLPKPGETVSTRALLIPPKAMKELDSSRSAFLSGDIHSSARHLERALQIYPHYFEAHNNLGSRYIELHEYEKAAAEFQKAIDLDSRIMQPFSNLSVALFLLQHYHDAEIAARRALDLDPHNSTAQYMLGCVLATEKRNPSEAMELLRQTEVEFPDSRLLLAQILLRLGAVDEAERELHEYLKVPGAEKKQKVECWLARLEQTSATTGCAQSNKR
jgi:thioredoxin-like negative regulator of GroEL